MKHPLTVCVQGVGMFVVASQNLSRKQKKSRYAPGVAVCVVACALFSQVAGAQSASFIGGAALLRMQQEQKTQAAEARQKKMATDAEKLVQMAQQLKTSVDKTNKDVLSVDVIREAERIEKLAREVREGMRQ